jgi:hypothetical protein
MRNYPFPPTKSDIELIRGQLYQLPVCPDAVAMVEKKVPVA